MMKKAMVVFAAAALFFGCEQPTDTKTVEKVTLLGGWTVDYQDPTDTANAYTALRTVNGAKEGLITGRFVSKNITLTADTTWFLNGVVYIGDNNEAANPQGDVVLTIEAGTVIKGLDNGTQPGTLVITRGSKIMAEGTAAKPIVFTSSKQKGARLPGDTGGIVIQGQAPINEGWKADGSGTLDSKSEFDTGLFGGNKADDNSGVLKYVRIEYSGRLFTAEKELNGLSLMGVGNGTTLSYIQIHNGNDDGIEMFGGTVNMDHIISTGSLDDSFDWTSGWKGTAQFVVLHSYVNTNTGAAYGEKGIEADNYKTVGALPQSNPTLANFTIIGRGYHTGMNFRVGTNLTMYNSVITNFAKSLDQDDISTHSTTGTFKGVLVTEVLDSNVTAFVDGQNGNKIGSKADANMDADTVASKVTSGVFAAKYKPTAAISAATAETLPAGLTAAAYIGAVDPAGTDWTTGWTNYDAN